MDINWLDITKAAISDEWIQRNIAYLQEWEGTPYWYYPLLTTKAKGTHNEKLILELMRQLKHDVKGRQNSGHDGIIDGYKTEIKGSIRLVPTSLHNHLSLGKDWDRNIFLNVDATKPNFIVGWMTKEDFATNITTFHHQQGGKNGKNDDYMLSESFPPTTLSFVKKIEDW